MFNLTKLSKSEMGDLNLEIGRKTDDEYVSTKINLHIFLTSRIIYDISFIILISTVLKTPFQPPNFKVNIRSIHNK